MIINKNEAKLICRCALLVRERIDYDIAIIHRKKRRELRLAVLLRKKARKSLRE